MYLGFACFCHFVAFALALSSAIVCSPFIKGSPLEVKTLNEPLEVTGSGETVGDRVILSQTYPQAGNNVATVTSPIGNMQHAVPVDIKR